MKKQKRNIEKDSGLPSIPEQSHVTHSSTVACTKHATTTSTTTTTTTTENERRKDTTTTTTNDDDEVKSLSHNVAKSLSLKQDDDTNRNETMHPSNSSTSFYASSSGSGPILVSEQDWELTWPIWHLLPIAERRKIAHDHGGMSIGEFEEYMTLSKALHVNNNITSSNLTSKEMYDNTILYEQEQRPEYYGLPTVAQNNRPLNNHHNNNKNDDDDEEQEDLDINHEISSTTSSISSADDDATTNRMEEMTNTEQSPHENDAQQLMERGGYMALLPQEIQDSIMMFLNVDYYAQCALVCKVWHNFTRSEPHVYKLICQRVYLQQSKRKTLHVSRFQNSYRNMLLQRPRVKMGTGLYVLKYSHIKKIQRDMWTEVPVGAILESVYYRYLYFHEHSKVLYALTSAPPYEMIARFLKMKCTGEPDKSAVWATYQVQKYQITVTASHPWLDVQMHLSIPHNNNNNNNNNSKVNNYCFDTLTLDKHMSSRSGDFDEYYSQDLVYYDVPSEPFRFLRDWRL